MLRTLTVLNEEDGRLVEKDVEGLVAAMYAMMKSLREHAEKVVFQVTTEITEYQALFKAELRVIEAATKWCGNLQSFVADLGMNVEYYWNSEEERQMKCIALVNALDQLWNRRQGCTISTWETMRVF